MMDQNISYYFIRGNRMAKSKVAKEVKEVDGDKSVVTEGEVVVSLGTVIGDDHTEEVKDSYVNEEKEDSPTETVKDGTDVKEIVEEVSWRQRELAEARAKLTPRVKDVG